MVASNQVTLTFAGDSDNLEKKFAQVEQSTDALEKEFDQTARSAEDLQKAFREVGSQAKTLDTSVQKSGKSFDGARESFDQLDTKAMGFRDTMTGVEDSMKGVSQISEGDLFGGFLTLGMGVGDLASGMVNFLIPSFGVLTKAVRLNTLALLTNPIVLGVVGVALLIAGIILLIKYWDEITEKVPFLGKAVEWVTERFDGLKDGIMGVIDWVKQHWPEIATIISGPFAPLVMLATDAFGIRSALVGAFNGIKNHAINVINEIIDAVNAVSSFANKFNPFGDIGQIGHVGGGGGGGGGGGAPGVEVPRGILDDSGARGMSAGSVTNVNINGPVYGTNYNQLAYEIQLELKRAGVQ